MNELLRSWFEPTKFEDGFPSRRHELEAVKAQTRNYALLQFRSAQILDEIDEDYLELVQMAEELGLLVIHRAYQRVSRGSDGATRTSPMVDVYVVAPSNLMKVATHVETKDLMRGHPACERLLDRYLQGLDDVTLEQLRYGDYRMRPGDGLTAYALLTREQVGEVSAVAGLCIPPHVATPNLMLFHHRFKWLRLDAYLTAPADFTIARMAVSQTYFTTAFDTSQEDDLLIAYVDKQRVSDLNAGLRSGVQLLTEQEWIPCKGHPDHMSLH